MKSLPPELKLLRGYFRIWVLLINAVSLLGTIRVPGADANCRSQPQAVGAFEPTNIVRSSQRGIEANHY